MSNVKAAGAIRTISPAEAKQAIDAGLAILVDVREPDEHQAERIAGAQLVPLSRFAPGQIVRSGESQVVFHCRSGKRSAEAARLSSSLSAEGIDVRSMDGGIVAWREAGLPTVSTAGSTKFSVMRQVQLVIGLGVLAGTAGGFFIDPRWLVVPAFFGAGLVFAGATGTCGLASVLSMMPWNRAVACTPCAAPANR